MEKRMTDTLKFAVLGTGFWSHYQIPAWFEVGGVELVAVYNRTVAKAEHVAQKFGVPRVYADPEELLQNEQLDFPPMVNETRIASQIHGNTGWVIYSNMTTEVSLNNVLNIEETTIELQ